MRDFWRCLPERDRLRIYGSWEAGGFIVLASSDITGRIVALVQG